MLRRLLLSDSSISLLLHGLKSVVALAVNWIVLAQFPSADYVSWAVSSSILVVATASDLGIGQYATTQYIHASRDRWPAIARESVAALLPLALLAIAFVYVALGDQPALYKASMAAFIALRVLSIPFGAALNAVNQFKIRKAIELGIYLISAVLILLLASAEQSIIWALLVMNAAFMMGGFLTIALAAGYLDLRALRAAVPVKANVLHVYRSSLPFLVNNLTGLLTYGGFIWISSFFLSTRELAKLSVLHTFVLVNVYQAYDVALRARQADLADRNNDKRLLGYNTLLMLAVPMSALLVGHEVLHVITASLEFTISELVLFSFLVSSELGFLLIQSIAQVRLRRASHLHLYAFIKVFFQGAAIVIYGLVAPPSASVDLYVGALALSGVVAYLLCRWHFRRQDRTTSALNDPLR